MTLEGLATFAAAENGGSEGAWRLRVRGRRWATRALCGNCARPRQGLRLVPGPLATLGRCRACGGPLHAPGFDLIEELPLGSLAARDRNRTLRSLGVRRGDVLSLVCPLQPARHLEVGGPARGGRS